MVMQWHVLINTFFSRLLKCSTIKITTICHLWTKTLYLQTAEYEQMKTTTKYHKSYGPCLKALDKVLTAKKFSATSISWTKFYWKPCQQNVEDYFSFNSKPLVGGSRVKFFHYGGQEDGGTPP